MFIRFKTTVAGTDFVWEKGEIQDTSGDENFWGYWVNQGVAEYVTEEGLPLNYQRVSATSSHVYTRPIKFLDNLATKQTRIEVPEQGSFNPGLAELGENYVLAYRTDELTIALAILDKKFKPLEYHPINTTNCCDPRLVWHQDQLIVSFSRFEKNCHKESIFGQVVMEGKEFVDRNPFRISPEELDRQKNWMPFTHGGNLYFISHVSPHTIYRWTGEKAVKMYETRWGHPWFYKNLQLRGNTNAVQLPDGNYLATFHTAKQLGQVTYYDNGAYVFEGKPPFKVLKCANRTYLPAEAASEKHFRKGGILQCNFPVGMVRKKTKLFISYGDNDSVCKIMETTTKKMLDLMVDAY